MANSQVFEYDLPTRDTLAGIYVEATDEPLGQAACVDTTGQAVPRQAEIFGVTVTVDDSANARQPNAQQANRRSASTE